LIFGALGQYAYVFKSNGYVNQNNVWYLSNRKGSSEQNPTEEAVGERKRKKKTHSPFKFVKNVDIKKILC